MGMATRTSGKTLAALAAGLLSLACGLFALGSGSDLFLVAVVILGDLAFLLGIRGRIEIGRSEGRLRGKALAGWAMGIPTGGFALGFLLLPAT